MKPFLMKLRTTPVITVLVALALAAGLFAIDRWEVLPMKGQAMPMYGEMHHAAKKNAVVKKAASKASLKRIPKGSGSSAKTRPAIKTLKRATQSASSTAAN